MPHDHDDPFEADNATRSGRGPVDHPTMLHSCARAATAAEARYRVDYPNSAERTTRILALDAHAAEIMYRITEEPWSNAHFLALGTSEAISAGSLAARDLPLSRSDGAPADLVTEISGADVVILVASDRGNAGAAEVVAKECFERGIMCAGLVVSETGGTGRINGVVNSMRPFTRVLVVAQDAEFVPAMLTALRA